MGEAEVYHCQHLIPSWDDCPLCDEPDPMELAITTATLKLEVIRQLHRPTHVPDLGFDLCGTCVEEWPCQTIEVIDS